MLYTRRIKKSLRPVHRVYEGKIPFLDCDLLKTLFWSLKAILVGVLFNLLNAIPLHREADCRQNQNGWSAFKFASKA